MSKYTAILKMDNGWGEIEIEDIEASSVIDAEEKAFRMTQEILDIEVKIQDKE